MKKLILLVSFFVLFFVFSCGTPDDVKILGTWQCEECGENVAKYSIKFDGFGTFEMEDEYDHYYGKWTDQIGDMESLWIEFDNGTAMRYNIKKLSKSKLVIEYDGKEIEFFKK